MLRSLTPKLIFLSCIFLVLCSCPVLLFAGCSSGHSRSESADDNTGSEVSRPEITPEDKLYASAEDAARICRDTNSSDTSGLSEQEVIARLGDAGYCAVDTANRINMVNAGQLKDFCLSAADGSPADAALAAVKSDLDLVFYNFHAVDGELHVERCSADWTEDGINVHSYETFTAVRWEYTEKGYFLFEQYREPGYDGPPGEFGFRVEPLDNSLRALNERYTLPIGYTLNNMFITDWSENTGFQALDFYDMYAVMYEMKYGTPFPYQVSFSGEEFEIPAQEFENVLKTYLAVDTDTIRERTIYHSDTGSYLYQPRGTDNAEQPYQPVPEVTACEELPDGTLKLTVEAVWIRKFTDRAAVSELVVRTAENGSFQYVSNHVTLTVDGVTGFWHTPR